MSNNSISEKMERFYQSWWVVLDGSTQDTFPQRRADFLQEWNNRHPDLQVAAGDGPLTFTHTQNIDHSVSG